MAQLVPHRLVVELAKEMAAQGVGQMGTAMTAAGVQPTTADDFAEVLAMADDLPELVTFVGYLGAAVQHSSTAWRVLYLNWQLQSWLLVEEAGVVYHTQLDDDTSPFKKLDAIWVKADASVGSGGGSQSAEARFLTGEFTRAGDSDASPTGGTFAAATGIFCEYRTPGGCGKKSRG